MRTATEAYNAQRDARDLAGDLHPTSNPVYRLPDPDEFEHGTLAHRAALRVRELYAEGHRERAIGEARLQTLTLAADALEEWLEDVGGPVMPKADSWDDDTDWKEGRW